MGLLDIPVNLPLLDSGQIGSLRDAIGCEHEILSDILNTFEAECKASLDKFDRACAHQDEQKVLKLAHFMAGSASNIGLLRFSNLCRMVEATINEGLSLDYTDLPNQLKTHYKLSLHAIRQEFEPV